MASRPRKPGRPRAPTPKRKPSPPEPSPTNRSEMLWRHPLLSYAVLETPPIREFYAQVKFRLVAGGDSCCIPGRFRFGKSKAIGVLRDYLAVEFPHLPVFILSCTNTSQSFSREFLASWSDVVRGGLKGTAYGMRERIQHALIDAALAQESERIVLFLDEVQNMRLHELQFLKDIYNSLSFAGIRLLTISVGQDPDLTKNLEQLGKREDLVKRFFGVKRTFRGIRLGEEVKEIFRTIDGKMLPGSTESWSQFFAPKQWADGWRLENEATAFTKALSQCGLVQGDDSATEIAAEVLFSSLRCYLVLLADSTATPGSPASAASSSEALWSAAVREAGVQSNQASPQRKKGDGDDSYRPA